MFPVLQPKVPNGASCCVRESSATHDERPRTQEDWPFHRLSCELHEKYHLADVAPGDPVLSSLNVPFRLSGSDVVALLQLWLRHHHALLVTGLALVPSPPPTAVLHITVSIPRGCQTHALAPYLALEEFPRSLFFPDRRAVVQANEADGETKFRPAFWDLVRSKAARGARGVVVQFGATRVAVWARQDEMDAVREWGKRLGEEGWWELFEWQARCRVSPLCGRKRRAALIRTDFLGLRGRGRDILLLSIDSLYL